MEKIQSQSQWPAGMLNQGINNQKILHEFQEHKIYICAIAKTKKRGKVNMKYPGYIFLYSRTEKYTLELHTLK